MEFTRYIKYFAALGVPGLALFVFMRLYDKFNWPLANMPPVYVFVLALVFLVLVATIVLAALYWFRQPHVTRTSTDVSMSIPKGCTFEIAARAIAGDKLISFEGFSAKELSTPLEQRQVSATSAEHLIGKLRDVAKREIRQYAVTVGASGGLVARVVGGSK
jgi:hypothetical protein